MFKAFSFVPWVLETDDSNLVVANQDKDFYRQQQGGDLSIPESFSARTALQSKIVTCLVCPDCTDLMICTQCCISQLLNCFGNVSNVIN